MGTDSDSEMDRDRDRDRDGTVTRTESVTGSQGHTVHRYRIKKVERGRDMKKGGQG